MWQTTAARESLALFSLPLLTLGQGIVLGRKKFSWRRFIGTVLAVGGLVDALSPRLEGSIPMAWKGDLIVIAAACVGAIFNVSVTANPITASLLVAIYLGEPVTEEIIAKLCAVVLGIAIATNVPERALPRKATTG